MLKESHERTTLAITISCTSLSLFLCKYTFLCETKACNYYHFVINLPSRPVIKV